MSGEPANGGEPPLICWPLDHFYSPIANSRALRLEPALSRVWPQDERPQTPGLDWRGEQQRELIHELGRQEELVFPDGPSADPRDYHAGNDMFSRQDAWLLQGILRRFRPRRIVEVGCGWSSLVMAAVNRDFFSGLIDVTCIEPYPPPFLAGGVEGITRLIVSPVEEVALERFFELASGDVLFIDSSHTVKTGGDVVFLLHEVLPRLAPGVIVHFHDIFLPFDYPQQWVFDGRAWNEQYAVRSFLTFNSQFQVLVSSVWMSHFESAVLEQARPGPATNYGDGGGSLWIRRVPAAE
jgi:predicted O-methyltransferase YrrM